MKTNEFIKEVESFGFIADDTKEMDKIYVFDSRHKHILAIVSTNHMYRMEIMFSNFSKIELNQGALYRLLTEYAGTLIKDRQEEKKYVLYSPVLYSPAPNEFGRKLYLIQDDTGAYFVVTSNNLSNTKFAFTESEIAAMPERFQLFSRSEI